MQYKRGDIYLASIPKTGRHVYYGERPVIIVGNDLGNHFSDIVIVCPITRQLKPNMPTHVNIDLNYQSIVICEQIITLSKDDLIKIMNMVSGGKMKEIDRAVMVSLGLISCGEIYNEQTRP